MSAYMSMSVAGENLFLRLHFYFCAPSSTTSTSTSTSRILELGPQFCQCTESSKDANALNAGTYRKPLPEELEELWLER